MVIDECLRHRSDIDDSSIIERRWRCDASAQEWTGGGG